MILQKRTCLVIVFVSLVNFSCCAMESGEVQEGSSTQQTQQQPTVQQGGAQQQPANPPMLVVLFNEKKEAQLDDKGEEITFSVPYDVVQESGALKHLYEDIDPAIVQAQEAVPIIHVTTPETFQRFLDIAQMMVNKRHQRIKDDAIKTGIIDEYLKSLSISELGTLTKLASYADVPLILDSCIIELAQRIEKDPTVLNEVEKSLDNADLGNLVVKKIPYCNYIGEIYIKKQTFLESRKLTRPYGDIESISWSPDSKYFASGGTERVIHIWDVATGKESKSLDGHTHYVWWISWSPDGKFLASSGGDQTIRIWDVVSGIEMKTLTDNLEERTFSVAWSPDSKHLASGNADGGISIWDIVSGTEIKTLGNNLKSIYSIVWSPDGKYLASGGADGTIHIWDVVSGTEIKTLGNNLDKTFSLAWSPDGKYFASSSNDKMVRIWNIANGETIKELHSQSGHISSLSWNPDGRYLAGGGSDDVYIWDVMSGKIIKKLSLDIYTRSITVAWSPDGRYLAVGGNAGNIYIWSFINAEILKECSYLTLVQLEVVLRYYYALKKNEQFNWHAKENERLFNIARSLPVGLQRLLQFPLEEKVSSEKTDELGED